MMELDLDEYAEGAIKLDGFESAIIGVVREFGNGPRILYSIPKILEILQQNSDMTYSDAEEYFDYNIIGGYFGEQNPIFLDREINPTFNGSYWEYHLDNRYI